MKICLFIEDDSDEWLMFSKMKKELGVKANSEALLKIMAIAGWQFETDKRCIEGNSKESLLFSRMKEKLGGDSDRETLRRIIAIAASSLGMRL